MRQIHTDILIVGGGTGGVAAALALGRLGVRCVITEPTDWLGGQLTSQGVPPDENQWIETFGGSASYQEFRTRVRAWYRANRKLTLVAERTPLLNPGGGWVSRLCCEPRVAQNVLREMLLSAEASGVVRIGLGLEPVSAWMQGDRCAGLEFSPSASADARELCKYPGGLVICAKYVLDATELGDVLELAGVEHAIGAEHQDVYGEVHARSDKTELMDQQAVSWCFALEHRLGESHVIDKPRSYEFWRDYVPVMSDGTTWTGRLFDWTVPSHTPEGKREFRMVPWPDLPLEGEWEMWRYRRIVDSSIYRSDDGPDDHVPPDVSLINMVQMDYWQRPLLGVSPTQRRIAMLEAREQSRSLVYWMQTEAPRHDGRGVGYPGLRLRGDEMGTSDGLAKACYIREARRLIARTIVNESHIGTEQRTLAGLNTKAMNWEATPFGTSERFSDSVGIGHYMIDLHPSTAGRNNVYVPSAPFRVPMGALIPIRVRNIIAAGKCLGVTHVTNGCYRMHHVEWTVGEAAGVVAARCVRDGVDPAELHASAKRVSDVQRDLGQLGVRMSWPWE